MISEIHTEHVLTMKIYNMNHVTHKMSTNVNKATGPLVTHNLKFWEQINNDEQETIHDTLPKDDLDLGRQQKIHNTTRGLGRQLEKRTEHPEIYSDGWQKIIDIMIYITIYHTYIYRCKKQTKTYKNVI